MAQVNLTAAGIKRLLRGYNVYSSVAEYVLNSLEAGATEIDVNFQANGLGGMDWVSVKDNGSGIAHDTLAITFEVAFSSSKPDLSPSAPRAKTRNGRGRLTFFQFAENAKWVTCFKTGGVFKTFDIEVTSATLNSYQANNLAETGSTTGTIVEFYNISREVSPEELETELPKYLAKAFCWFLEMHAGVDIKICVNGVRVDHEQLIWDRDAFSFPINEAPAPVFEVECRYVRWKSSIKRELSRMYFINSHGFEIHSEHTSFNKKNDGFHHSVFIASSLFDNFDPELEDCSRQGSLLPIFCPSSGEFKEIVSKVQSFLTLKRKPVLKEAAAHLVSEYEKSGAFPQYGESPWDKLRYNTLRETISNIYQAEPKVFSDLNSSQKKIFVRFIDLLMATGEEEKLLTVIEQVVDLDSAERERLYNVLTQTSLSSVIKMMEVIQGRFQVVENLKRMLFAPIGANEVNHVQKLLEANTWIIGEAYNLLTAAEPDFEQALREFRKQVFNDEGEEVVDHEDKNREMDLFMARIEHGSDTIKCVVVEIKHPSGVNLGKKQYEQVRDYLRVVTSAPRFNSEKIYWEYHLIGKKFATDGYIKEQLDSCRAWGEQHLVHMGKEGRHKIYAKTWSDLVADFEIRHQFVSKELHEMRNRLSADKTSSPDDLVEESVAPLA